MTQFSGRGHRVPAQKYGRWPLFLFPFSGTASGRTYPTPLGGVVQTRNSHLAGNTISPCELRREISL